MVRARNNARYALRTLLLLVCWVMSAKGVSVQAAEVPSYEDDVAPVLTKYCGGCHTEGEDNGELSMDSWESLMKGGERGVAVTPGSAESSRLVNVLLGKIEPKMPPEGEPGPNEAELDLLRAWIDGGAQGPDGDRPPRIMPRTPKVPASRRSEPVTALAVARSGEYFVVGRHQSVELVRTENQQVVQTWKGIAGKVEGVSFSRDDSLVVAATGLPGVLGEAVIWRVADGSEVARVSGHRDALYAAVLNADATLLATAGYDRRILLWDLADPSKPRSEIAEHNGPIYDLAITPDGNNLVSASDDSTVKIWRTSDGQRMDTRSEPLREQYTTAISPDGQLFVAGGEDNRIRVWRLISRNEPAINPMLYARFAHEEAIQVLRFSEDGRLLLSVGKDRLVKLWETTTFRQVHVWPSEPILIQTAAISVAAGKIILGGTNGKVELRQLPALNDAVASPATAHATVPPSTSLPSNDLHAYQEAEPNNSAREAQRIDVPAEVTGAISSDAANNQSSSDVDVVRFASRKGESWMIEVHAASDQSALDSHVEVLTADGERIPRVELQAVRDSYFTFRGKDSMQTGDFRVHNWEEMRLNQLLYCNGEVVKLYHYPRGPDSGFNVYPNYGNRHAMFDTTPMTHALQEPCYIVEPIQPGATLVPNGLPVFTIYYENDDDAMRKAGTDSRLTFTAPQDGEFVVRVVDVRGQGGDNFKYRLAIRPPRPNFNVRLLEGANPQVGAARGRRFGVEIDRLDGFEGPVNIELRNVPEGLVATTPITVEPGHLRAWGTIWAAPGSSPPANLDQEIQIVASATIAGQTVEKEPISLGKVAWSTDVKLRTELLASSDKNVSQAASGLKEGLPVIEVVAGTTGTALVRIAREGFAGPVTFGGEDAAWNAPHGVYVSNIGLNGVLIPEDQHERVIFLAVEPWVVPQDRLMFVTSEQEGNATSNPVWLRILPAQQ